jgi:hypothetical protein
MVLTSLASALLSTLALHLIGPNIAKLLRAMNKAPLDTLMF